MIVVVDIDHTLSDAAWRDSMIGGPGGWDEYHSQGKYDKPIPEIVSMVNLLAEQSYVIALTTRPEKWRQMTLEWLARNGIWVHEIIMRGAQDFRPAPISKIDMLQRRLNGTPPTDVIIMDDRDDVITAFRVAGFTTLQVHARRQHDH